MQAAWCGRRRAGAGPGAGGRAWAGAAGSITAAGLIATLFLVGPDNFGAFAALITCAVIVLLLPPLTVGMAVDALHQRRRRRQLRLGPTP